jgi:hypothetical protein
MLTPKGVDITTVTEEKTGVTGTAENAGMNGRMTAGTTAGACNTGKKSNLEESRTLAEAQESAILYYLRSCHAFHDYCLLYSAGGEFAVFFSIFNINPVAAL